MFPLFLPFAHSYAKTRGMFFLGDCPPAAMHLLPLLRGNTRDRKREGIQKKPERAKRVASLVKVARHRDLGRAVFSDSVHGSRQDRSS